MSARRHIAPAEALRTLGQHILLDGFGIVLDLEKSKGCNVVDAATGRTILDLYGCFGSLPLGFNHPGMHRPEVERDLLVAARAKAANSDVYSTLYAEFVRTFRDVAGLPPLERYFFIEGGALAVENALKAAMDWKVRKNLAAGRGERGTAILHFEQAFHGRSGYTLSLTNTDPVKTAHFAKFPWPRVAAPALDFNLAESDREKDAARKEAQCEAVLRNVVERDHEDIAAIIIEPIQGEGGDRHFSAAWLRALRKVCDEHDILLIFDEVQTGGGTTGRMWCCQHFGVLPDLLAFGKKVQACGVMAGPRLDEVPDNVFRLSGRINSTWGGSLVDMVRATHVLRLIEQEGLLEHAAFVGDKFLEALRIFSSVHPVITAVRGRGLMIAFDLPTRQIRDEFYKGLYDLGLLALRSGERSIRFRPALDLPESAIDRTIEILEKQCRRTSLPVV
ncbi:L-lysine 6-transaminase [Roseimicrobium sp. ORNL1]|uniref:L-lysine 6-transaminase n=1 Tax=Roseimicrobium sp. ORNL1 TaxID=2711231 RepID=UPI0013E1DD74|nr:L-lysine 6-transaminase [Roseimicrobium sp. ORNL1]QIF04248.1 L-lysine 6-transaminase [Roseimicrobium sp. ORNL1]